MRTLLEDRHFIISYAEDGRLCHIRRTAEPFASTDACIRAHESVADAVVVVPVGARATFDVRLAPPRNDPEFERVVTRLNTRMFRPFTRVAFLVRTAIGRLHVKRLTRDVAADVEVFDDDDLALDWLRR